ncbi:hypothetical protein OHB39_38950 [Streptomyces sp. NBC_00047]|uniref:hypothetical protein n=1 Tax=Streptomyces sp. NBC_00047 TaxID=2975627 RepID=UPI00224DFA19|nr:hypothetical protein [Streptomyces sp. NBC_00047]MCX5613439.1 hypothetical protein [Streptomyces sp. NBC_00047]
MPVLAQMADPPAVDGHVKLAPCLLNAAGAAQPALVIDGNFGVLTLAAVRSFRAGPLLTLATRSTRPSGSRSPWRPPSRCWSPAPASRP